MRAPENYKYTQAAAGNGTAFPVNFGGFFSVAVVATFGGGSVELQVLGPDATTWLSLYDTFNNAGAEADLIVGKFAANGAKNLYLSPGQYRFVLTTATVLSATLSRVPGE